MAKTKGAGAPKESGYDPDALAEFKAALDGDQAESFVQGKSVEVDHDDPAAARKVPVQIGGEDDSSIIPAAKPKQGSTGLGRSTQPNRPPPEMQHMLRSTRRPRPWGWIIGGLFLIAGASLAGFFVFNRAERFSGTKVQMAVKPTAEVASGGTMTVTINYQNQEPVDLVKGEIAVEYPEGFTFVSANRPSANQFNNAFSIGTVRSGQAGTLTITGTLIGAVDTQVEFSATMTYRPANFNSDFQTKASGFTKISSSILDLSFTGPTKLAPGANATWVVTYKNTSDKDLANVQIEATYPDQFTVSKTDPTAQERAALWRFPSVPKNGTGTITISGTVNGAFGDSMTMIVRAGLVTSTNTVDLQDEQSLLVILVKSGLNTTVAVNGTTDQSVINAGDTLNYTIRVSNQGDVEITGISVQVALEGRALKMTDLQNPMGATVKNNTLTWTEKQSAALTLLKPGQEVALNFSVGTVSPLTIKTDADKDPHVSATATASSPLLPVNTNSSVAGGTVFITKVRTIFTLAAEARYFNDDGTAVGAGPLPPKVGQSTSYRIAWTVLNSTSDATDMSVTTTLPNSVFWTGQNVGRDAGDIAFDPTTRTIKWTLNKVPAGTGTRFPKLTAHFDVSITPSDDQIGTVVILVDTSAVQATDSYAGTAIAQTAPSLTSDLPTDRKAAGQGKVQG